MDTTKVINSELNALTEVSLAIDDQKEAMYIRKSIGRILGIVYEDLMLPVIREYQDLDPDR